MKSGTLFLGQKKDFQKTYNKNEQNNQLSTKPKSAKKQLRHSV